MPSGHANPQLGSTSSFSSPSPFHYYYYTSAIRSIKPCFCHQSLQLSILWPCLMNVVTTNPCESSLDYGMEPASDHTFPQLPCDMNWCHRHPMLRQSSLHTRQHTVPLEIIQHIYLRSAGQGDLTVPRTRTVGFSPRSFSVAGPSLWNTLPYDMKQSSLSIAQFCSQLKSVMFVRSFYA